jgi:hypothetical protein
MARAWFIHSWCIHGSRTLNWRGNSLEHLTSRTIPDKGIADAIAREFAQDSHLFTRKLAETLNITASTVWSLLTKNMWMKSYYMRWIQYTLICARKAKRAKMTHAMLLELIRLESSNFHFIFTEMSYGSCMLIIIRKYGLAQRETWMKLYCHRITKR